MHDIRLIDLVPGLSTVFIVIPYFFATVISPILAVTALLIGVIIARTDLALAIGGVAGIAYQGVNFFMQWDSLPRQAFDDFVRFGIIGATLAGIAWAAIGHLGHMLLKPAHKRE